MAVSLVVWQGSTGGRMRGKGGGSGNYGSISGERIRADDMIRAEREVVLRYFFSPQSGGRLPDNEYINVEQFRWLWFVQLQERFGIHVSSQSASELERAIMG